MADKTDVLLELYKQAVAQGLHHQTQRSTLSNLIVTLCAAIVALISLDRLLSHGDLPLTFSLIVLGAFGAVFTWKQHERYAWYKAQMTQYRNKLDQLTGAGGEDLQKAADIYTKKRYGWLFKFRVWWLWVILHVFIALIGAVLTIVICPSGWSCLLQ